MMYPPGTQELKKHGTRTASDEPQTVLPSGILESSSAPRLSLEQTQVLDCLQAADGALTLKQIQSRLSCPVEQCGPAVDGLLELRLVCELNTIVPSYAYRYRGVRLFGE